MNGRGRVLVIDDELLQCSLVRRVLGRDHDVTTLASAREALARIGAGETFDLILCDVMMPELTGVDFHERLTLVAPELLDRVVFMTGGAFTPRTAAFLDQASVRVLRKPFELDDLRALARDHLRR